MRQIYLLIIFTSTLLTSVAQTVVYVDADATGANNGFSWANAFNTIQPAIDVADLAGGGEVWVAEGLYFTNETNNRDQFITVPSGIDLYGGFDGTEVAKSDRDIFNNVTAISGDIGTPGIETDNSKGLIRFPILSQTQPIQILDGFIIEDAYINDGSNGALSAVWGGNLKILNCIFRNNTMAHTFLGAALQTVWSIEIINCEFYSNISFIRNSGVVTLTTIESNSRIVNSLFYDNQTTGTSDLGVIGIEVTASFDIVNSTFNTTSQRSIQIGGVDGSTSIKNNIIFTSQLGNPLNLTSGDIDNNIISNTNLPNNFNVDPEFIDFSNNDFRIDDCSPAINRGDNSAISNDITIDYFGNERIFDGSVDIGFYEYQLVSLNPTTEVFDVQCTGDNDGQISVNANGQTPEFKLSTESNFVAVGSGQTISGLPAGTYTINFRDANGCTSDITLSLSEPSVIDPNVSSSTVKCSGEATGQIRVNPFGGTPNFSGNYDIAIDGIFQLNVPSFEFSSLDAGSYTITVRDINGCEIEEEIIVTESEMLNITTSFDRSQVKLTASGGTAPYEYSVDGTNFQTDSTFTLPNGQYTFTVRDANGCEATTSEAIAVTSVNSKWKDLSFYPNPVKGALNFKGLKNSTVKIMNIHGFVLLQKDLVNPISEMSLESLKPGVYLLQIADMRDKVHNFRIIKE